MRIDAHMHFTPAGYHAELTERSLLPFPLPAWSAQRALAFMDGRDIDKAVLSLSPPGVAFGDRELGVHLARLVNEATASEVAARPGRSLVWRFCRCRTSIGRSPSFAMRWMCSGWSAWCC